MVRYFLNFTVLNRSRIIAKNRFCFILYQEQVDSSFSEEPSWHFPFRNSEPSRKTQQAFQTPQSEEKHRMRFAIFSDIHANLEALQEVLKKCTELSIDAYLCLGDTVGYNANPHECLEIVRSLPLMA